MASSLLKNSLVRSDLVSPAGSTRRCARLKDSTARLKDSTFASKIRRRSLVSLNRGLVSMAADVRDAGASLDSDIQTEIPAADVSSSKVTLPPRMCSLREFGEGTVAVDSDSEVSNFFNLLAANVELSYKVQDWEILSGRLAMMVFVTAVLVEAITGNSVFDKMDPQRLLEITGAIFASIFVAAGFAIALQAKTRVAYSVSKGYENVMNSLIDSVFDGLLFNGEDP